MPLNTTEHIVRKGLFKGKREGGGGCDLVKKQTREGGGGKEEKQSIEWRQEYQNEKALKRTLKLGCTRSCHCKATKSMYMILVGRGGTYKEAGHAYNSATVDSSWYQQPAFPPGWFSAVLSNVVAPPLFGP